MSSPSSSNSSPSGSSSQRSLPRRSSDGDPGAKAGLAARFAALPPVERRFVLAAAALLPLASLALRVFGLGRALGVLRQPRRLGPRRTDVGPVRLGALVHAVAERLPFPSTCLERSALIAWFLCRRGFRTVLVIETATDHQAFQAHAWVDTEDGPIGHSAGPAAELARWTLPESAAS